MRPRPRARSISSIASRLETWTITTGTSTTSASETARCVASRSTAIGRVVACARGATIALRLVAADEVADRVLVLAVDHDERAGAPGAVHGGEDLGVVQPEALIGHEDLEGGVAVLDERRQFLAEHLLASGSETMRWKETSV